jgi:hypothetical protein
MGANDSQIEHDVRRLSSQWVAALVHRDTAMLADVMAGDCTFTYPLEGDGTEQFIADVASGDLTVESMVRDNVEVRVFGQTADLRRHREVDLQGSLNRRVLSRDPRLRRTRRPLATCSCSGLSHRLVMLAKSDPLTCAHHARSNRPARIAPNSPAIS